LKYFGAAYYPDYTPREEWERDIALMQQAGMNVTRITESSWQNLEPSAGDFRFTWLEDAVATFAKYQIKVILSTPTYIPPLWLVTQSPDILSIDEDGQTVAPLARHHYCYYSQAYLEATDRIVEAMGQHFGRDENVIGWQIHNELGLSTCYCTRCLTAFHRWLQNKYGTIAQLNAAWLETWSHTFTAFEQVTFPNRPNGEGGHILPLIMDHRQFRSDTMANYQNRQKDILKKYVGDRWITHNSASGMFLGFNTYEMFAELDVAGWDNYPDLQGGWRHASLSHRLFRGLKARPHWALEQICGRIGNDQIAGPSPSPGQIRRWIWHTYAMDAEGILFWLWRSKPGGNWPYWQGILAPNGVPSERYDEISATGNQFKALWPAMMNGITESAHTPANPSVRAALLLDYDDQWLLAREKGDAQFHPNSTMLDVYEGMMKWGLQVDVLSAHANWQSYPLIVASHHVIERPEVCNKLEQFVRSGGILILGPRTSRYTPQYTLSARKEEAPLHRIAGIQLRDYDIVNVDIRFVHDPEMICKSQYWLDLIETAGAETLATVSSGRYRGKPISTWHSLGQGGVIYVAGYLDFQGWSEVLHIALKKAYLQPYWRVPHACEVIQLGATTFIFNHSLEERVIYIPGPFRDYLSNDMISTGLYWLKPEQILALGRIMDE
jgi:beta-galactosidase